MFDNLKYKIFAHLKSCHYFSSVDRNIDSFDYRNINPLISVLFLDCVILSEMSDTSDLDQQIEQLRKCEIIKESEVKNLCAKAREILGNSNNQTKTRDNSNYRYRIYDIDNSFENLARTFLC